MKIQLNLTIICFLLLSTLSAQETRPIWLDDLPIKSFSEGIPAVLGKTNAAGDPLRIAGTTYPHGVGVNSTSILAFYLNSHAQSFSALVGVDDEGNKTLPHKFYVIGDRKILFESREMKWGDPAQKVEVDLQGIKRLGLLVKINDEGINRTYSNWADAKFVMLGNHLPENMPNTDEKYILTPAPGKAPRINSPKVFGARPGNPFLYTIAATGQAPINYSAKNLPQGLRLDPKTGIITGSVAQKSTHQSILRAKNKFGKATQRLTIKIGDTIALTPPIGWNGWNSWARNIDQEKVIASADAMVKMGLRQHGWTYINIDDAWQGQRGGPFNAIQPNEKFPDFKGMVDYIHSLGLKVGIYSTPMITSYAGYTGGSSNFEKGELPDSIIQNKRAYRYVGKYRFERNDARQMAAWGIDYLKYDWRIEVESAERMSAALQQSGRDIFYSISNSAPFAKVKDWVRLTNSWRTGPDIRDSWHSLYVSAFTLDKWAPYGGPGHWNDPDMMILGNVTTGSPVHPTRLTPDEQYSHVSLFSLLSAPLLIGCPIEQLDAFTLNLLTNDEVIAIDQDPLGKPARLIATENGVQIWLKSLADGSYALGLFNVGDFGQTPQSYFRWDDEQPLNFTLDLTKLGLNEKYQLRDVWRQKDLGGFSGKFQAAIPHHGVVMLKIIAN
ncbi:NPCBM/NEW2 domain-containing protein [Haliscomenobacter hydrossis]|uniref:Alpha-galactosidase n=1 Tax=Haliscomenobacter hydrossis (strain ATCC 27775 / DSM 1100 / LMG 10767 / O) TaxID=760192 RepID=F4KQM3_HALH1|nr:NPCBM/NEW2 domain-containing protein [Haliscomenobacter hydrossis]AEE50996.1 Alpha-galactosidase [Haliscomenobacter hydrossis DSM 1100]